VPAQQPRFLPAETKPMSAEKRRPAVFSQIRQQPAVYGVMSARSAAGDSSQIDNCIAPGVYA
jgi:hypothetical protein